MFFIKRQRSCCQIQNMWHCLRHYNPMYVTKTRAIELGYFSLDFSRFKKFLKLTFIMSVLCFFCFIFIVYLLMDFILPIHFFPLPPILLACVISIPSDLLQKPEKIFINVSILSYSSASWVFQSSKIKKRHLYQIDELAFSNTTCYIKYVLVFNKL